MSDEPASERSYLPWILAALVLVVGGAKLEPARPLVARLLALAIPVVPVAIAVKRVEGGGATLERAAGYVGWFMILAGEACVGGGFFQLSALAGLTPFARFARSTQLSRPRCSCTRWRPQNLGKARFAGYLGIAGGFAWYISNHTGKRYFRQRFWRVLRRHAQRRRRAFDRRAARPRVQEGVVCRGERRAPSSAVGQRDQSFEHLALVVREQAAFSAQAVDVVREELSVEVADR